MRRLIPIMFVTLLVVPALAQDRQVKLTTQSAPSLRILSVAVSLDREKRKVTLSLEVENTGDKTIKEFACVYRTHDVMRGYNVSITADMPAISVVLMPGEKRKVVLLDNVHVPGSILSMRDGEIAVASLTFEDGSAWKRKDKYLPRK